MNEGCGCLVRVRCTDLLIFPLEADKRWRKEQQLRVNVEEKKEKKERKKERKIERKRERKTDRKKEIETEREKMEALMKRNREK
jgi:hypothetical protein